MRLLPTPRMKTDQRKPGGRYKEPVLIGRPFPSIFFFMFSSSDLDPRHYSLSSIALRLEKLHISLLYKQWKVPFKGGEKNLLLARDQGDLPRLSV